MGEGNARTGRLKLGLQIAAACVVVLIGAFAVGSAVAGPFFWYSCSLDGLEAHGRVSGEHPRVQRRHATRAARRERGPPARRAAADQPGDAEGDHRHRGPPLLLEQRDRLHRDRARAEERRLGGRVSRRAARRSSSSSSATSTSPRSSRSAGSSPRPASRFSSTSNGARTASSPTYLNDIYFGQQAYGIEAAAHAYFGVHAKDLTLEQAALLAGLPQAPSSYDPLNRPGRGEGTPGGGLTGDARGRRHIPGPLPTSRPQRTRPAPATDARARGRVVPERLHHEPARRASTAPSGCAAAACGSTRRSTRRCRPRRRKRSSARSTARATRPARSSRSTRRPARSVRWPSPRRGSASRSTSRSTARGRRDRRSRCSC